MFRIILCSLCLLFFLPGVLPAQKLLLSEREDINLRNDDFSVIGTCNQQTAVYRKRNNRPEIIFYNAYMHKVKSVSLDFVSDDFSRIYFAASDERILVFYQQREERKEQLYGAIVQKDYSLSSPVLLQSVSAAGPSGQIEFLRNSSEDGRRHLLHAAYYNDGAWVVQAMVVDESLKTISRISQLVSVAKEWAVLESSAVSNQGNALLLMAEKPTVKGATESVKLLFAAAGAGEFASYPVALNKHTVSDLMPACDNRNTLFYLAGFYADGRYNTPKGVFFSTFDEEQQAATVSHFTPLAMQLSGGKGDLRDFKLRHLSIKSDGGVELSAEKYFQNTRTITSMNPSMSLGFVSMPDQTRTIQEYYYDEVAVFNLKPDGNLAWSQTMLKEQQSADDGGIYSSIGVMEHKAGKVYFFNDLNSRQARLMAGFIANNSDMVMRELPTTDEMNEWNWMPRSAKQISKREIVMPCTLKGYLCFLKISF